MSRRRAPLAMVLVSAVAVVQAGGAAATTGVDPIEVVATGSGAAIEVDANGNLYVVDGDAVTLWAPGADAGVTVAGGVEPGNGGNELDGPRGIAVDANGDLYVADSRNRRIMRWPAGGSSGELAGMTLDEPAHLARHGEWLYVADTLSSMAVRRHVITEQWELLAEEGEVHLPHGVAVDREGNLYVSDLGNHSVVRWTPDTDSWSTVAGANGSGNAADQLSTPLGLTVDDGGNLYVADAANSRVQRWAPGASHGVTVAGGDGRGVGLHQLRQPCDVAIGPGGHLYVADCGNGRVVRWPSPPPPSGFSDLAPGAFYVPAVEWAEHVGLTTGDGRTGRFAPGRPLTRGEAVTTLWRFVDRPGGHPPHGFPDVVAGAFYDVPVAWARSSGVTTGVGPEGTRFAPDAPLSRAQAVTLLWRVAGSPDGHDAHAFPDVPAPTYYEAALRWARAERITNGVGTTGRFEPDRAVSRAEMVVLVRRLAWTPSAWADPTSAPPTVLF